jgi:hypothetical protein
MARRRCIYCDEEFTPKPHVAAIQKCCGKKRCEKQRKADAQAHWVSENPDYFKGRYPDTKRWLKKDPCYLERYRAKNPEYVAADNRARRERKKRQRRRADIQDAWPRREIRQIHGVQGADIQDTCRLRLDELLSILGGSPGPIYKTQSLPKAAAG